MQQVKIFKSVEAEVASLEKEINDWIAGSNFKIVNITGNIAPQTTTSNSAGAAGRFSPSDVLVIVLYET